MAEGLKQQAGPTNRASAPTRLGAVAKRPDYMPGGASDKENKYQGGPLESAIERVENARVRIDKMSDLLEKQLDRVSGYAGNGEVKGNGVDAPTPSGLINQLHVAATLLENSANRLEMQAMRTEQI